ncbi:MAG: DNA-directed RNA polymerase subunit alpha [Patescibacteria group bacterium]|nr:DNA-directed RNA polymerase subunit alpha [Patescibacteria group bacterium]
MLEQVKITPVKEEEGYGLIVVEPLPQGYGVTLGNALRRILLSSLPGAAVTSVKINGVPHEFSTIKGVKEDVVQLLLNLKNLRLKIAGEKAVKLTLSEKGPKEIKASDIKVPAEVEVINPDLVIANLADSKTKLEMELTAECGSGYVPVEDRKAAPIGVIPLDATFTPVKRVNYKVEATRVGQITNFDKLTLEVTTDGTAQPTEALKEAARILTDYFKLFVEPRKIEEEVVVTKPEKPSKIDKSASVEELELPTRVTNSLKSAGISTIGDLLKTPRADLLKLKNLGAKSLADIESKMEEKGISVEEK